MISVALDAMGGDLGLAATVQGAADLSLEEGGAFVYLVGESHLIAEALEQRRYDPSRLAVVDASGCVPMDGSPRAALQAHPNCSILTAARLVASGKADALVSAGNTGGTILASSIVFSMLPGIRRAALASVYPTEARHGPRGDPFALILDVGATLSASSEALAGFALMGSAYSSIISEIEFPKVALLSNGSEANKGTPAIIGAHRLLSNSPIRCVGNVEGLDIPRGTADVIVCDGFLGNVVLKMLEGIGEVLRDLAKQASARRLQWRIGLSMLHGGLQELKALTDWKVYGGAPLLGFDQIVIKAHGRSEARAIRNAIKVAAKAANGDLIGRIRAGVDAIQLQEGDDV